MYPSRAVFFQPSVTKCLQNKLKKFTLLWWSVLFLYTQKLRWCWKCLNDLVQLKGIFNLIKLPYLYNSLLLLLKLILKGLWTTILHVVLIVEMATYLYLWVLLWYENDIDLFWSGTTFNVLHLYIFLGKWFAHYNKMWLHPIIQILYFVFRLFVTVWQ